MQKPDGLTVIHPKKAIKVIENLPIEAFWGVGQVTAERMHKFGIRTGKDLREKSESFSSCSHGAGRKMGRNEAVRSLSLEDEIRKLDKKGIVHAIRGKRDLEEAPSAYKNIVQVMADQEDLVKIKVELSPLAVIKG